ncbi:MAG: SRPBCC family protein [Chloroflexi bacterium]|nr:SRPBCC family protein [Chloroflexota bacterium]
MANLNVIVEPGKHDILMTRDFDAPRDLVFRAYTDPDLVPRWWGPRYVTTIVDTMEAKPGGRWRYVQSSQDGAEYGFHGVYHDVQAPERIVYTFEFEGMPGHVLLETLTFEEVDGKTRLTDLAVFQTVEARDGMVAAGMEGGATESWDRFEDLLKTL